MRYLRGREDGFIYEWNPILAENSSLEEVTEEEAYPERFVPKAQKGRQTKLTLDVQQVDAPKGNRDVDQEASKGL